MGKGGAGFWRACGSAFNKFMSKFNRLLAYDTPKVTRVLDWRLGVMNYFFQLVILGYLCLAIYVGGAYKVNEHAVGTVVARVKGESYSTDQHKQVRFWDYADSRYPPVETGAVFLATRVLRTNLQVIDQCANPLHSCSGGDGSDSGKGDGKGDGEEEEKSENTASRRLLTGAEQRAEGRGPHGTEEEERIPYGEVTPLGDPMAAPKQPLQRDTQVAGRTLLTTAGAGKDSKIDPSHGAKSDPKCSGEGMPKPPYGTGKCAADGLGCLEHIWCPPEGTNPLRTLDMTLADLEPFEIEFEALISFNGLLKNGKPLRKKIESMSLSKLLKEVGADEEEVKETGGIFNMQLWWECSLETPESLAECSPQVKFSRLDKEGPGFSWRRATYYYTSEGERARDVQRMVGIRIKMSNFGYGTQTSILHLILQLSIGLTLLGFAGSLTDYIMLNMFSDAMLFEKYKIEESEDFGDLRERLQNLDAEQQVKLLHEKRRRVAADKKKKKRR